MQCKVCKNKKWEGYGLLQISFGGINDCRPEFGLTLIILPKNEAASAEMQTHSMAAWPALSVLGAYRVFRWVCKAHYAAMMSCFIWNWMSMDFCSSDREVQNVSECNKCAFQPFRVTKLLPCQLLSMLVLVLLTGRKRQYSTIPSTEHHAFPCH